MAGIYFRDVHELADCLPDPPEFSADSPQWVSQVALRGQLGLSIDGLQRIRKRYRNRFEHVDGKRAVYLYFPFWMLMYAAERSQKKTDWSDYA